MNRPSSGALFRAALREEKPLQVVGAINAYAARLAKRSGVRALYVSGGTNLPVPSQPEAQ